MPILKSSKKALRSSKRKAGLNASVRERYKNALLKARKNPNPANLKMANTLLDKAAKINVIHKNKAARLKSRLAKLANKKAPKEEEKATKITKKKQKKIQSKPKKTS